MKTINKETALQALRDAVAERGIEYVYQGDRVEHDRDTEQEITCFYVHQNGQPGCGVGLALHRLGVPLDVLKTVENLIPNQHQYWMVGRPGHGRMERILRQAGFDLTKGASEVFRDFQQQQDNKRTWGASLQTAELNAQFVAAT